MDLFPLGAGRHGVHSQQADAAQGDPASGLQRERGEIAETLGRAERAVQPVR